MARQLYSFGLALEQLLLAVGMDVMRMDWWDALDGLAVESATRAVMAAKCIYRVVKIEHQQAEEAWMG